MFRLSKVKSEYFNNTKIAKVISTRENLVDTGGISIKTIREGVITDVDLVSDERLQLTKDITPYDMAVQDAIYSLYQAGCDRFTVQMVGEIMSGNTNQDILPQKIEEISRSIHKMRHIDISIDCTEEWIAKGKRLPKSGKVIFKSYLLPLAEVKVTAGNQMEMEGYRLLSKPALYDYAEHLNQIVNVPIGLLATQELLSDNTEVIIIKRYLIKKIALMKNKRNDLCSDRISLEWYDKKNHEMKGLYAELGYHAEDYSKWRDKKAQLRSITVKILEYLKSVGYIKSYQEYLDGREIKGYEIEY